jgi:hypothetical protein
MVKDVASHNFPFWNCLGKRCAALPFVDVASHTALAGALHSICPGSPKTGSYESLHPKRENSILRLTNEFTNHIGRLGGRHLKKAVRGVN